MSHDLDPAEVRVLGGAAADETLRALTSLNDESDEAALARATNDERLERLRQAVATLDACDTKRADIAERREYLASIIVAVNALKLGLADEDDLGLADGVRIDQDSFGRLRVVPASSRGSNIVLALASVAIVPLMIAGVFVSAASVGLVFGALIWLGIVAVAYAVSVIDVSHQPSVSADRLRLLGKHAGATVIDAPVAWFIDRASDSSDGRFIQFIRDASPVTEALRHIHNAEDIKPVRPVIRELWRRLEALGGPGAKVTAASCARGIQADYAKKLAKRNAISMAARKTV